MYNQQAVFSLSPSQSNWTWCKPSWNKWLNKISSFLQAQSLQLANIFLTCFAFCEMSLKTSKQIRFYLNFFSVSEVSLNIKIWMHETGTLKVPCGIQQRLNEIRGLIQRWVAFCLKVKELFFAVVHLQIESAENSQWGRSRKELTVLQREELCVLQNLGFIGCCLP